MTDPAVAERVENWASVIGAWADDLGFQMSESVELFLEPMPGNETCMYYFVDHATRDVLRGMSWNLSA